MLHEKMLSDILNSISKTYNELYFLDVNSKTLHTVKCDFNNFGYIEHYDISVRNHSKYLIHEDDREFAAHFLSIDNIKARLVANDIISEQYRRKTKKRFEWMHCDIIKNTEDENHAPLTVIIAIRNINSTAEKQLRTNKLLESTLKQAKEANKAQNTFLAKISHDIRTPLNGILGMAAIASLHTDDLEKTKDCLDKILYSGKHLLGLINDILDYTTINNKQSNSFKKRIFVDDFFENIIAVHQSDIDAKKLNFIFQKEDIKTTYAYFDTLKLHRIITNLLSNAIKYTDYGGTVKLTISEKPTPKKSQAHIIIAIEDTGIGISKDFLDRILDPFSREDSPYVTAREGAGLGMSIASKLIESLNGTLDIESEKGIGTKVTISIYIDKELPENIPSSSDDDFHIPDNRVAILSDANNSIAPPNTACSDIDLNDSMANSLIPVDSVASSSSNNSATCNNSIIYDFTGKNILVAEDDNLNLEIICEYLTHASANVVSCTCGLSTYNEYISKPEGYYDAILMDVRMPKLNGYEATEKIRASRKSDALTIPIIAITAYAFADDYHKALRCGMNDHCPKPIIYKNLMHILSNLIYK